MLPFRPASDYKKLEVISQGSYGQIFKFQNLVVKSQAFDPTFVVEMAILRQLKGSSYVIELLDVAYHKEQGEGYLILPLAETNLHDRIQQPHTNLDVVHWMYQLMLGVNEIHSNDILHLDLKPDNILLIDNVVKIADFGMSRPNWCHIPASERKHTKISLDYRPPEILARKPYDDTSDLWSVGCIFYYLLRKERLFYGSEEEIEEEIKTFDPVTRFRRGIDKPEYPILQALLNLSPEDRYLPFEVPYFDLVRSNYPEPQYGKREMKLQYPESPMSVPHLETFFQTARTNKDLKAFFDGVLYQQYTDNKAGFDLASYVGDLEYPLNYGSSSNESQFEVIKALNGMVLVTTAYDYLRDRVKKDDLEDAGRVLYLTLEAGFFQRYSQQEIANLCLKYLGYDVPVNEADYQRVKRGILQGLVK